MAFDMKKLSEMSGEAFGDINEIFMKKDGKPITPNMDGDSPSRVNVGDIAKNMEAATVEAAKAQGADASGRTIINISKDLIDGDEDVQVVLTALEERRRTGSTVKNKHYIDLNTGDEVTIVEHTEMYNGTTLLTVKQAKDSKLVTYPRGMFVGKKKMFVPREYYVREAERVLEDTVDRNHAQILAQIKSHENIQETEDTKFLELVLNEPIPIVGGILVPDKIQIPVKRLFDLEYKIMILENVICVDNKIAGLLFIDIWF